MRLLLAEATDDRLRHHAARHRIVKRYSGQDATANIAVGQGADGGARIVHDHLEMVRQIVECLEQLAKRRRRAGQIPRKIDDASIGGPSVSRHD